MSETTEVNTEAGIVRDPPPWIEHTVQRIQSLEAEQRLPHALGLVCPPGWGLKIFIDQVVKSLLRLASDTPASEQAHHDLFWAVPEKKDITVDTVRDLAEFAVQTAQLGPRKVAVVWPADNLNASSGNALLKILEEPPRDTHLLLCTERWSRLLPTVRSRTQRFAVPADWPSAQRWLEAQGVTITDALLAEHGNAPLRLADQAALSEMRVGHWLSNFSGISPRQVVDAVPKDVYPEWLACWYRLVLHEVKTQAQSKDQRRKLLHFARELLSVRRQIMFANGTNATLLMDALVYRWLRLSGGKP